MDVDKLLRECKEFKAEARRLRRHLDRTIKLLGRAHDAISECADDGTPLMVAIRREIDRAEFEGRP